eukprot:7243377-Lingulodinium_polyedra.AAC.1
MAFFPRAPCHGVGHEGRDGRRPLFFHPGDVCIGARIVLERALGEHVQAAWRPDRDQSDVAVVLA